MKKIQKAFKTNCIALPGTPMIFNCYLLRD